MQSGSYLEAPAQPAIGWCYLQVLLPHTDSKGNFKNSNSPQISASNSPQTSRSIMKISPCRVKQCCKTMTSTEFINFSLLPETGAFCSHEVSDLLMFMSHQSFAVQSMKSSLICPFCFLLILKNCNAQASLTSLYKTTVTHSKSLGQNEPNL